MIQQATSNHQQTNTKRSQRPIGQHGNIGTSAHAHRHQHKYSQSQASFLRRCEDPHLRSGGGRPGGGVSGTWVGGEGLQPCRSAGRRCIRCGQLPTGRRAVWRRKRWCGQGQAAAVGEPERDSREGDWESWRVPGPVGLAAVATMAECPS